MIKKDYVAYAMMTVPAVCLYFFSKEVFGFPGGIFGFAGGMGLGLWSLKYLRTHSFRTGAYLLAVTVALGTLLLYSSVKISAAMRRRNLAGSWLMKEDDASMALKIEGDQAIFTNSVDSITTTTAFQVQLLRDSLIMTSATGHRLSWHVISLTESQLLIGREEEPLEFSKVTIF